MRIIHLTDNYSPVIGGLERSVQSVAGLQTTRGHQVAVVTAARRELPAHRVEDGVEIYRLPFALQRLPGAFSEPGTRVFFPTVDDHVFGRAYGELLRKFEPDVIHAHGWIWFSAARQSRRSGAAIVSTAHDYGAVCVKKTYFLDGMSCSGPGLAKCIRCGVDQYGAKGVALALGLRYSSRSNKSIHVWTGLSKAVADAGTAPRASQRQSISVVPSYVPDSVLDDGDQRQRPAFVPAHGPYIFYAGALGEHKGVRTLLDAHSLLKADGLEVPLVLAGVPMPDFCTGPLDAGVQMVNSVPHDQIMAAWSNASVGVVPSIWPEPFGQVAVESMAAGAPTIVSAVGGLTDIVEDGVSGLHVQPADASELANCIRMLLEDPLLATRLSQGGKQRAKLYTVSAVFPQIEATYERALAARDMERSVRPSE